MKLVDLDPHWIGLKGWVASDPFYVGVSFLCPHCPVDASEHGKHRRRRLAVNFWPPIDPYDWLSRIIKPPAIGHTRVRGETFDTLTLSPSIGFDNIGHWHGHIIDGKIC